VTTWVVVGDPELRNLLLAVADEAGLPVSAIEPEDAALRLASGETPDSMLVTRSMIARAVGEENLKRIRRLAIASASADGPADGASGLAARFISLPADLESVERTLAWLVNGAASLQPADPSSSDSTSTRA
jgi:hypothetical protein